MRLFAAADPYTKDLLVAALETGFRSGELRSLQWQDVQDDVLVLTAEKTKTRRKRLIPISPTLRKVPERRRKGPDGVDLPATAHVFGNAVGEPIPRRLSNTWWNVARRKQGLTICTSTIYGTSSGRSCSNQGPAARGAGDARSHEYQDAQHLLERDDPRRQASVQEARSEATPAGPEGCSSLVKRETGPRNALPLAMRGVLSGGLFAQAIGL